MRNPSQNDPPSNSFCAVLKTRALQPIPIESRVAPATPNTTSRQSFRSNSGGTSVSQSSQKSAPVRSSGNRMAPRKHLPAVANYNLLREKEAMGSSPKGNFSDASAGMSSSNSSSVVLTRHSNGESQSMALTSSATGFSQPGFMEGPLPSEVREIIRQTCPRDKVDDAEREARRLLSTSRRVRVYREEMQAAMEEMGDAKTECERQSLVCNALCGEVDEINRQIEALIKERTICEEQLAQSQSIEQYKRKKLDEAQERVNILRNTIDNIDRESHMGYLLLRQMVPNLNIMNYA